MKGACTLKDDRREKSSSQSALPSGTCQASFLQANADKNSQGLLQKVSHLAEKEELFDAKCNFLACSVRHLLFETIGF